MSSICGIFHRNLPGAPMEPAEMMRAAGRHPSDVSGEYWDDRIFLGCHLNRLVPESQNETMPCKADELVITADAVIDNRKTLFDELGTPEERRDMPDSLLILEAYKKWGTGCAEKLTGDFAFAIWDPREQCLYCARDHVGRKTLYYHLSDGVFAFSTLMNPLLRVKGVSATLNDTWITDFLSLPSQIHELDPHLTVYEELRQLPPASWMLVKPDAWHIQRYWEIKRTGELRLGSEEEYKEAFRELYAEAVNCRLRCVKKVGVTLSGGLDSSSVACLAAQKLKCKGDKLYSFTQVPMASYENWLPQRQLADESEYAMETCRFAGNIEPSFYPCEEQSALTIMDPLLTALEQPYKILGNSHWVCEILKSAASMGVGVMLNGQFGNFTVSWGSHIPYLLHLLRSGNLATYLREANQYCRSRGVRLEALIRHNLYGFLPQSLRETVYFLRGGEDHMSYLSPVNMELFRSMEQRKRFKRYGTDLQFLSTDDSLHQRLKLLNPAVFSHAGVINTKLSLAYGVEQRDPTYDKRLIEFCINLPERLWLRDGLERGLIRSAMKGFMPDKVRMNTTLRGRQSADWVQRLAPLWEKAREELWSIGELPLERKYLDISRIRSFLDTNRSPDVRDDGVHGLTLLLRALVFSRFLRSLGSQLIGS